MPDHTVTNDLPDQLARTDRFMAGRPHSLTPAPEDSRVAFCRAGELWVIDADTGVEWRVADAETGPISAYATDQAVRIAAFAVGGRLRLADLEGRDAVRTLVAAGVEDPRPDPTGSRIAYVSQGALRVVDVDGTHDHALVEPESPDVTYGLAEFTAYASIGRDRGFWWAPDGNRLLVARADVSPVQLWYLHDPDRPEQPPAAIRYPAAGTANADVSLHLADLAGRLIEVEWDRAAFEYLVAVDWSGPRPIAVVQARDQRTVRLLEIDRLTGRTTVLREETDRCWVHVAPGVPERTASGEPVWITSADDTYRLMVGPDLVTPPGLQVEQLRGIDGESVVFTAQDEPTEVQLYAFSRAEGLTRLSQGPGVHDGTRRGGTTISVRSTLDTDGPETTVTRNGKAHPIRSDAERPVLDLRVELIRLGARELRTAVFWPSWHEPGSARLPVMLAPYAGPGAQRVLSERTWHHLSAQWFAEQGFAVIVTDGRGTPGRGPAFEREIYGDIVHPVLDDQVDALHAAAERFDDLDLDRVVIRGWSFSGFLSAAAVLHRPDVFHAAVAGAAVTDQRLYDTFWKERFLGHPDQNPDAYEACSLLPCADRLERPLLLIHGLADTNVWSTHLTRFTSALLAAGKPHSTLVLPGQGHRPTDRSVVTNLPRFQVDFLREALGGITPRAKA